MLKKRKIRAIVFQNPSRAHLLINKLTPLLTFFLSLLTSVLTTNSSANHSACHSAGSNCRNAKYHRT